MKGNIPPDPPRLASPLADVPLRLKALLGIGATLAVLILAFSWVLSRTLSANFETLQNSTSLQQVNRVLQSLQQASHELNALLYNYTNWTVTYEYAQGKNPAYWEDNYMPLLFQENTLDVVLVYDMKGKFIGGRAYDRQANTVVEPTADVLEGIRPRSALLGEALWGNRTTGFVNLPQGVLMAAARPILTDMGEGPATGVMVFGRYLEPGYVQRLATVSGVDFIINPIEGKPMVEGAAAVESELLGGATIQISQHGSERRGHAVLKDIESKPAIGLEINLTTGIYAQMEKSRRDIILLAVGAGLIMTVIALGLMERLVLRPLAQVEGDVHQIARLLDGTQRLQVRGGDEFGGLARSVNHMLDELQKSELRYSMLAEVSPVGMFQTDAAGNCSYVNQRCCEILKRSAAELSERGLINAVSAKHRDNVLEIWLRTVSGLPFEQQFMMTLPTGGEVWVLGQISPQMDSEGRLAGYVGTITDITERIRLEQEQMKVSKLESIGVLAGGIAHDFRNLLTPILCNISLARVETDNPEVLKCLDEAEMAVKQTNDLTQQLLIFSRGGSPQRKSTHLPDLLHESAHLALSGSSVEGHYDFAPDLWPVEADLSQISRAIQNLVINAVQAMPGGGQVTVSAANVTAIEHPSLEFKRGKFVRIQVRDQGAGISDKDLDKIFDPYFTTKSEGNGLGLATVFSIMRHHHGYIGVESAPGEGATFSIYLPATELALHTEHVEKVAISAGIGKILVMDDDLQVLNTLRNVLRRLGYLVDSAAAGEDALELYEKGLETGTSYDAVILDLTIKGGLGGKDTMAKLLDLDPQAKGIVASGYSDDTVMANFRSHGFCDSLPKPYTIEQISQVLKRVLGDRPVPAFGALS